MSELCQFLLIFCCCFSVIFAFHTSKHSYENLLPDNEDISVGIILAKRSATNITESGPLLEGDLHGNQPNNSLSDGLDNETHLATNETEGHESEGNHSGEEAAHQGIHLAALDFQHVQAPFIIAVFLMTAGIAKLGNFLMLL